MRYSKLVYMVKMCRTLLEASEYMAAAAKDSALQEELRQNGRIMLGQMESELTRHEEDLLSDRPKEYLKKLRALWETGGSELADALEGFAQCLQKHVHYQVRAVFFTGLGSTWDAMESVYEYMRSDPRFDPVVVLIPIIRVHEQENEIIYEDYLTARKIPFYEHNQYSIDEDLPDLAFMNQPYEGNTIAAFWPETLARHTRLVYLPYFLSDMVERQTLEALCRLPVYRYAWKVVCSNEKVYRYYSEHALNEGVNGLVTGIPKMDYIATISERGIDLPTGWECLKGRKCFLWNTWYNIEFSALQWFDKIVSWFAQHEECALIWRPHPMTDTITKLYHPNEYADYKNYFQRIEAMPNAVCDQSVSLEASFYYSDAMISDYSSLQPQYLLMDKPTLWVKNNIWGFTGEEFIESSWMEQTETEDGVIAFLDYISNGGTDRKAELRKSIRQRDLPLADGHAGERVCETLWQAMHKEDFYPKERNINE